MIAKRFSMFLLVACLTTVAIAADKAATGPTCCIKHSYCCTIKATCCDENDKTKKIGPTAETELVPLTFVSTEATKPTCCDKRAYCCTIKAPCCGKTLVVEVAALTPKAEGDGDATEPTCCAKRAYCCSVKATCCDKESKADFAAKAVDKSDLIAAVSPIGLALPSCCAKLAYCCTIKSPCCGKTVELEIER